MPQGGTWEWIPYLCGFSYRLGLNHLEVTFLYIFCFWNVYLTFKIVLLGRILMWNLCSRSQLYIYIIYIIITKTLTKQMLLLVMPWKLNDKKTVRIVICLKPQVINNKCMFSWDVQKSFEGILLWSSFSIIIHHPWIDVTKQGKSTQSIDFWVPISRLRGVNSQLNYP